jgi:hypothetical protein
MSAETETFAASMTRLHNESGGYVEIATVRPVDVPSIVASALAGDAEARRLLVAVNEGIRHIRSAPRRKPALCVCCPRPLRAGQQFSVVVVVPVREAPEQLLALGVCARCATTTDEITAKAIQGLRRLWPALRPLPQGGHA